MAKNSMQELRKNQGRGKLLIFFLIVHTFIAVIAVWFSFAFIFSGALFKHSVDGTIISFIIIGLVAYSAFAIWTWRKYSRYLLGALFVVWLLEFGIYELPSLVRFADINKGSLVDLIFQNLAGYMLFSGLYALALKRKWHLFS